MFWFGRKHTGTQKTISLDFITVMAFYHLCKRNNNKGAASCSTKNDHSEVPFLSRSAPFMDDIVVSNESVTKLLKGLIPSKALGPYELHPRVLKELVTELGPVFAHLFQKSLDTGVIPKNGLLQIYVPFIKKKKVTGLSYVIIVPSH